MTRIRLLTAAVGLLLYVLALTVGSAFAEEVQRFNRVEIWRLHVNWRCAHHDSQVRNHPASESIEELSQNGDLSGSVSFRLVKSRDSNANIYQWETLDQDKPTGQISYTAENATKSTNKRTGKASWFKMAASATGIGEGSARLTIDAGEKKFHVAGYAASEPGQYEQTSSLGPSAKSPMGVNLSTGPGDWQGDLPGNGLVIRSETRKLTSNAPIVLAGRPMEVSWTLEPWKEEDLPEVWVEPQGDFDQWMPKGDWQHPDQPGNSMTVFIRVHEKGDRSKPAKAHLSFSLPYISEEKGVCLNWPAKGAAKNKGLRLRQEDQDGSIIMVVDDTHAKTIGEVEEATMVVSAFDYGAWGTLRVSGTRDGQNLPVKVGGKETPDLDIPIDDNGNRIADAWERQENVEGFPKDWDACEVDGHKTKGDGLALYDKYRGLIVRADDGSLAYVQPKAREKCHFVIDPSGIFDFKRWYLTSGVRAYRVDATITQARRVDFNGTGAGNGKYAVQIDVIPSVIEPDPWPDDKNAGNNPGQLAYTVGTSPREAERVRIFPGRVKAKLERIMARMRKALAHPEATENAWDLEQLNSLGVPLDQIKNRLAAIDDAELDRLTHQLVVLSAIHEMGHVCGIDGHRNAQDQEDASLGRSPECPMNYLDSRTYRLYLLDGKLGGGGQFCWADPDNCWTKADVKEREITSADP